MILIDLKIADRAKQIKNHAKINKDSTDKLVKELREENEKLKKLMEKGTGSALPNGMATPIEGLSLSPNGRLQFREIE